MPTRSGPGCGRLVRFVLDFRHFDQATKNRTELPPDDLDVDEILELLESVFPNGRLAW